MSKTRNRKTTTQPPNMPGETTIPAESFIGSQEPYITTPENAGFGEFAVRMERGRVAPESADTDDLSLRPHLKAGGGPGEPADKQVLIRLTEWDRQRWGEAARVEGVSVSEFVRSLVNERVRGLLECDHPVDRRRVYRWAEFCQKCGARLRG